MESAASLRGSPRCARTLLQVQLLRVQLLRLQLLQVQLLQVQLLKVPLLRVQLLQVQLLRAVRPASARWFSSLATCVAAQVGSRAPTGTCEEVCF
jgi:hypothetical protein